MKVVWLEQKTEIKSAKYFYKGTQTELKGQKKPFNIQNKVRGLPKITHTAIDSHKTYPKFSNTCLSIYIQIQVEEKLIMSVIEAMIDKQQWQVRRPS